MFPSFDFNKVTSQLEISNADGKIDLGEVPMITIDDRGTIHTVVENGKVVMCKTDKEKIQVYLQTLLRTRRDKVKVYQGTGHGMTYLDYRGRSDVSTGFIKALIERELEGFLSKFRVFESLDSVKVQRFNERFSIEIKITLVDGDAVQEVVAV